ncbi:MAG: ABC transporter permease [Oligoflexales bacterium]|nr:ABC transporter permease [Oligoflexales bacterium]
MINKSLVEMVKGRWREFKREPSAMFFVVFMPILWMLILGLAFSDSKQERYSIGLKNGSHAEESQVFDYLAKQSQLKVFEGDEAELATKLKRGEVLLMLELDAKGQAVMHFDPSNPEAARAHDASHHLIQEYYGRTDPRPTIANHVKAVGSRYIDFLIPGLLALSLFTSSLFGTGMTIVANRRENLLKRYMATPMNPYEYIVSHIIGRYFIFAVEFCCILGAGMLMFGFQVQGNWLSLITVGLLGTASFTSLGILCGSRTANTSTYNGINNLLTLPMMMLSGVWFSRAHFPDWLASIVEFLPLTACVDAIRRVALEGVGLASLGFELGILAFYTVACTVFAKMSFKWY